MMSEAMIATFEKQKKQAQLSVSLKKPYFETKVFEDFRARVFKVLLERDELIRNGIREVQGAALIGPPGIGKTRMVEQISADFRQLVAKTGGLEFGSNFWSVTIPSRATVKEICELILRQLGYPISPTSRRNPDYLIGLVRSRLKDRDVAALHLDEVQDSGRYTTNNTMKQITSNFRNLMQDDDWPVSLIVTGTMEAKAIINDNDTFLRRLEPIEVLPMEFSEEGVALKTAGKELLKKAGVLDDGLLDEDEFIRILMHASAQRFGIAIEILISAISSAGMSKPKTISFEHFAKSYYERMNCDDALNPFLSRDWRSIDTMIAMDRHIKESRQTRRKPRQR
ncbi:AAA family ATPase [Yoonia sp. 2307UL14-13]|uniref:AAA family ATPase n=1 Tax=Yoonia sp. 2307UL14-13 TaxID=3126506 RepID=UPI00309CA9F7